MQADEIQNLLSPEGIAADVWDCCESVAGLSFSNAADFMDGFDGITRSGREDYPYVIAGRYTWDMVKPRTEVS